MTDMAEPISIAYTVTDADLEQLVMNGKTRMFGWTGRTRQRVVMGYLVVAFALVAYGLPEVLDFGPTFEDRLPFYVGLLITGLPVLIFFPAFMRWSIRRSSAAYQTLPLKMQLLFDESGIRAELDGQTGHTVWRVMTRAIETDRHILIYLNRLRGFVIPKSVFADPARLEHLRQLVRRHIVSTELRPEGAP